MIDNTNNKKYLVWFKCKVPFDPQYLVTGQDLIGQIIIHKGCRSAEIEDASSALYLYIICPAFL